MKKKEILTNPKKDRRILSNVPDPDGIRLNLDRRGSDTEIAEQDTNKLYKARMDGQRYIAEFPVVMRIGRKKKTSNCVDISNTGILVQLPSSTEDLGLQKGEQIKLKFQILSGAMPEGFEMRVNIKAKLVRQFQEEENKQEHYYAFEFLQSMESYHRSRRWGVSIAVASILLFFMALVVMLMRAESIIYFQFNKILYAYSLVAATFLLSRYIFGMLYRNVKVNPDFEPGVSIIIPVFNEEEWIQRTITTCFDQTYPIDKLEVIIVDDQSSDRSMEEIRKIVSKMYQEGKRFKTKNRLKFVQLPENGGKREALVEGVKIAKHELVAFVDSDSFLEPNAIRNIVQPFQDPKMGGVAGRTEVENKFTNTLTKLQTVRYYIAFRIMKAAEATFDCVTCLSGPLSCYRKELVLKHADAWLDQRFLGHPATFGDDRSMTNLILETHRTSYQDRAVCSTIVPSEFSMFLKQQMRWKRSWLRETLRAMTFIFKKEPFMVLFFIVGFIVPVLAPIIVLYNLVYVPVVYGVFPLTFIIGLLVMALMLSFAHLLFRRSKLWFFGFVFVMYYEFILLWQMPVAWVTFWKSTWGTRDTPQDVSAREKKLEKKQKKAQ
ncbi:glycosyltransferase [Oceanobacillus oncorhynchi]|uniref:glycosyltransferase n=1 Tax=Oceanobacillus oncorhynchi TaxID=545501 RepID=UPI001865C0B2|nr:glycosyltransferase [Oceanobacillus oncorhynchi]UUI40757.1 glycosyltransferase [Oceanobacillus oncorhynchi]